MNSKRRQKMDQRRQFEKLFDERIEVKELRNVGTKPKQHTR